MIKSKIIFQHIILAGGGPYRSYRYFYTLDALPDTQTTVTN